VWNILLRCLIMYLMVILAVRLMGKRQIGELQPSELVITLLISELASIPIQDKHLPILRAVIPIFALVGLELVTSLIALKSTGIRTFLYGRPLILIYKGEFRQKEMALARVTIDDIMEVMRNEGVSSLEEIDYAVLETNGQLSIIQKENKRPICADDLKLEIPPSAGLPHLLIMDGRLMNANLKSCGVNEEWVTNELRKRKISSFEKVFIMMLDDAGKVFLVPKQ